MVHFAVVFSRYCSVEMNRMCRSTGDTFHYRGCFMLSGVFIMRSRFSTVGLQIIKSNLQPFHFSSNAFL
ncbi:hypothetical protein OH687_34985 [Burkholderia anthina]|nr:hypothetical protein OH687_34985 [Burkholderia anthina]